MEGFMTSDPYDLMPTDCLHHFTEIILVTLFSVASVAVLLPLESESLSV